MGHFVIESPALEVDSYMIFPLLRKTCLEKERHEQTCPVDGYDS